MSIEPGKFYPAVLSGGEWMLTPMCEQNALGFGVVVEADGGAVFWRGRAIDAADEVLLSVKAGESSVVLPVGCVEQGCTGDDELCGLCPCESELSNEYIVSISGMPALCGVEMFNGVWTVSHVDECHWSYAIDEWRILHLNVQAGPFWRVSWQVSAPGGLSGYFGGYDGEACAPQTQIFYPWDCTAAECPGLCNAYYNDAMAVVSLA